MVPRHSPREYDATSDAPTGDGVNWSDNTDINQSSAWAPSLAVFDGTLWVAFADSSAGTARVRASQDGVTWSESTNTTRAARRRPHWPCCSCSRAWTRPRLPRARDRAHKRVDRRRKTRRARRCSATRTSRVPGESCSTARSASQLVSASGVVDGLPFEVRQRNLKAGAARLRACPLRIGMGDRQTASSCAISFATGGLVRASVIAVGSAMYLYLLGVRVPVAEDTRRAAPAREDWISRFVASALSAKLLVGGSDATKDQSQDTGTIPAPGVIKAQRVKAVIRARKNRARVEARSAPSASRSRCGPGRAAQRGASPCS
jgi:hypothetical protein